MAKIINPFIVTGKIAPEYFCDRVSESARLVKSVTNGNNLVVISPRRMGKTGLIQFCYDKPEIGKEYYTFFIDILHTSSLREFTYLLGREIYETLLPRSRKMATLFIQTIKSISGKFGFDPITNLPAFNVELGDIERPEYTLDEIFQYLAHADKPCIVAIDEFQQIAEFKDSKTFQKRLRSIWQLQKSVSYCLFGSKKHLMNELFEKRSLPFYKFGDAIYLTKIGTADWVDYICGRFEATGKQISKELAEKICQRVDNHSSYVQQLAWLVWIHTDKVATEQDFEEAYQDIIDQNTPLFEKQTESLTTYQMNFLRAIIDGVHSEFTTQEVLQKYQLGSSANVSIVKRALVKKELIEIEKRQAIIPDPVMKVWLKRELGV